MYKDSNIISLCDYKSTLINVFILENDLNMIVVKPLTLKKINIYIAHSITYYVHMHALSIFCTFSKKVI